MKGFIMKKAKRLLVTWIFCCLMVTFVLNCAGEKEKKPLSAPRVDFSLEIARVWSGQRVDFFLVTRGNHQCVAYYDEERRMTLAIRTLDSMEWDYYNIPDTPNLGWSSHKDIVLEFDDDGYLHVTGNMHGTPMIYFIATKPWDIYSLKRIDVLVDPVNELKVTYPRFERGAKGEFIFHYRDGSSGKGNEIYNQYDVKTKTWRRYLDTPLVDGEGKRNAYNGFKKGPDGYFHLTWMWRDTPDVISNHDLCYARSLDLLNWETIEGKPIALPITFQTEGVIVDPILVNSGLHAYGLSFDSKKRPIFTYIKFDKNGNTQGYNARLEKNQWKIYQTSDWDYRWYAHGFGAIAGEIGVHPVKLTLDGYLTQTFDHIKNGKGTWILDEKTLKPTSTVEMKMWPEELMVMEDHTGHMQINWKKDAGESGAADLEYVLRWETLPPNRDRPNETIPRASNLKLYRLKYGSQ
jgi:hypothetical protein